jgi:dephospho-CoA kinase
MSREVVSVVGMAGSGKSEVARVFEDSGFTRVRFGNITDREIERRGLTLNEVVIDGLYSWEEYLLLKNHYGDSFHMVAVWSSPGVRHTRLSRRPERSLTPEETASRDRAEIENTNKGGPIAVADFTILNESSLEDLRHEVNKVISNLKR